MRRVQRDDDDGVLAALAFVDGSGVGQADFLDLVGIILDDFLQEIDFDAAVLLIDTDDSSEVAVENALVVIIA